MFVPGPNIIGYWFVYRAICHLLALLGIRRARRQEVPLDCQPSDALNDVPGTPTPEATSRLAAVAGLRGPDALLRLTRGSFRFLRKNGGPARK